MLICVEPASYQKNRNRAKQYGAVAFILCRASVSNLHCPESCVAPARRSQALSGSPRFSVHEERGARGCACFSAQGCRKAAKKRGAANGCLPIVKNVIENVKLMFLMNLINNFTQAKREKQRSGRGNAERRLSRKAETSTEA